MVVITIAKKICIKERVPEEWESQGNDQIESRWSKCRTEQEN